MRIYICTNMYSGNHDNQSLISSNVKPDLCNSDNNLFLQHLKEVSQIVLLSSSHHLFMPRIEALC